MNALAPINISTKPTKERKVSKRVLHAIDLLVSGQCKTQKDAAEKVGLTRERLCRALKEDHVIRRLELAVKRQLAMSAAPAAGTLLNLLTEARSEHVRKDCATTILGMNGVHASGQRAPLVSIGIGGGPGYILDLRVGGGTPPDTSGISEVGGVLLDEDPARKLIDVTPNAETVSAERPATAKGWRK
jgi:hypothetical protein